MRTILSAESSHADARKSPSASTPRRKEESPTSGYASQQPPSQEQQRIDDGRRSTLRHAGTSSSRGLYFSSPPRRSATQPCGARSAGAPPMTGRQSLRHHDIGVWVAVGGRRSEKPFGDYEVVIVLPRKATRVDKFGWYVVGDEGNLIFKGWLG
jgi:hypothetical protein